MPFARTGDSVSDRVLLVDDEPRVRETLQAFLELEGYECIAVGDAQTALGQLERGGFNLLLCDIMMPGMTGLELLRAVRQGDPELPVIMLTGFADSSSAVEALRLGAYDYLSKPFHMAVVTSSARRALETRHLRLAAKAYQADLEITVAERTAQLKEALARAESAEKLKSNFLSLLSHELLTPLTPLLGYLSLLVEGGLGPLTREQQEAVESAQQDALRLAKQVEGLLTFVEFDRGVRALSLAVTHLLPVVTEQIEAAAKQAAKKGVRIECAVQEPLPPVKLDRSRMGLALAHLLDNAVKFTAAEGTVTVSASEKVTPAGARVELSVKDTGIGIPSEALSRIFDQFFQVDVSKTRSHDGIGMGLALVKVICDAHGFPLSVESVPDHGTTVRVIIPVEARQESPHGSG
jgi:signal transduction histidine kinase